MRAFGLEYGIADQNAHIPPGVRAFSARLTALRIPHHVEVFDGDHYSRTAERLHAVALPYVANALDRAE